MKRRVIKVFLIFSLSLYEVFSLCSCREEKTDVSKGVKKLKRMETRKISDIENKIKKIEDTQEKKMKSKKSTKKNYKAIFANSVIMGDSITEAIEEYGILYSGNIIAEVGVSLTALDGAVSEAKSLNPQNIFVAYGHNDIGHVWNDYKRFKKEYQSFIIKLKKEVPNAHIYANSIFPVKDLHVVGNAYYKDVKPYNKLIKEVCKEQGIVYLDNTEIVEDKYYEPDSYHFVASFYPLWLNRMIEVAGL